MSQVTKSYRDDEAFREVANLLFGDGSEISKAQPVSKANPDGADLSTKGKKPKETPEWQKNVALGTNAAGAIGGPAAIYQAAKGRKTGGMPRDAMRSGKLGGKLKRVAQSLDTPKSKKAAVAAGIAGGAMVGIQGANWTGDAIAARMIAQDKKKKVEKRGTFTVVKSAKEIKENASFPNKHKLTAASITTAARASGKGIEMGKGKLKKLPEKVKTVQKNLDITWEGEISKVDDDKRQVFGWASIVKMNGEPVVDLQGDYITIDEVEKSAYDYVHKSRKGGDMHLRDQMGGVDQVVQKSHMIESMVVTDDKKKVLGLPDDSPTGWWVGYQINDDDLWGKVKSGERKGFSIHGRGVRS